MHLLTKLLIIISLIIGQSAFSQEMGSQKKLNLSFDLVSQHLWRGFECGQAPSAEPSVTWYNGNFNAGVWAARSFDGSYNELDLYAGYSWKEFSLTFFDYYCPPSDLSRAEFTEFHGDETFHYYLFDLAYNGTEKLPLQFMVSTMFLGADRDTSTGEYHYSTYLQGGYTFRYKKHSLSVFAGGTPYKNGYASDAAVVNTGISYKYPLQVNEKLTVPFKFTTVYNPDLNEVYFSFSLSFSHDFKF